MIAESADWLVADKPPFLEAHPSKPNGRQTLWDGLRALLAYELVNGGQVSIINRLDRETSEAHPGREKPADGADVLHGDGSAPD